MTKPPQDATARVVGHRPKHGQQLIIFVVVSVFTIIAISLLVAGLVLLAGRNIVGAIFLIPGVIAGPPWIARFVIWVRTFGRPYLAINPTVLWASGFQFAWDEVVAAGFVDSGYVYRTKNHQTIRRGGDRLSALGDCSFVVTLRTTDRNGRPLQYGQTLPKSHSSNLDEFYSAVRAAAPHVQLAWSFDSSLYEIDQNIQSAMTQELSAHGAIWVRDHDGKPKLTVDPNGGTLDNGKRILWTDVAGLQADVRVLDSRWGDWSDSVGGSDLGWSIPAGTLRPPETLHRLNIYRRSTEPNARDREPEQVEYEPNYHPPLEQVIPLIQQWAPHITFSDVRRMSPTENRYHRDE